MSSGPVGPPPVCRVLDVTFPVYGYAGVDSLARWGRSGRGRRGGRGLAKPWCCEDGAAQPFVRGVARSARPRCRRWALLLGLPRWVRAVDALCRCGHDGVARDRLRVITVIAAQPGVAGDAGRLGAAIGVYGAGHRLR